MSGSQRFEELVQRACGRAPYPFQHRIAQDGFPELLRVPTGSGKTVAAVLPWIYRRRFHADPEVRSSTPHWLVYVLPVHALVEPTHDLVSQWVDDLHLTDCIGVYTLTGGEGLEGGQWRQEPDRDAIFVTTADLALSRALNRGYGQSRWAWPIDFGLFNSGVHWVFDEAQLLGPALPTSRQLQGLRECLGTALGCTSMWMSAAINERSLRTVDRPHVASVVELADDDRRSPLAAVLSAPKLVSKLPLEGKVTMAKVAEAVAATHRKGTRTIFVANTVERAAKLFAELDHHSDARLVLLHSRFRPADVRERLQAAMAPVGRRSKGTIVVTTPLVESSLDISAATVITEAAPWPSIVLRAGRCNRYGEERDAELWWLLPPTLEPYNAADIKATSMVLEALEGRQVTGERMASAIPTAPSVPAVLRRRDLLELFDTTPDLAGHDLDVSRFLGDARDLDVYVTWRTIDQTGPESGTPLPGREERCPVPARVVRHWLADVFQPQYPHLNPRAWRVDPLSSTGWVPCTPDELRPGQVLIVPATEGGYRRATGWESASHRAVPVVDPVATPDPFADSDLRVGDDPATFLQSWVGLRQHLDDVEQEVRRLDKELGAPSLHADVREAVAMAARLHDVGKVHPCYQSMLLGTAATLTEHAEALDIDGPLAMAGGSAPGSMERAYFRHELASALALLDGAGAVLEGVIERDLVVYLVAAHHGRVRLGFRRLPDEVAPDEHGAHHRVALGVIDGESLPAAPIPGGELPQAKLDLSVVALGESRSGAPSWCCRMLALRDRPDLGPFRLAFLEAVVRVADWRAGAVPAAIAGGEAA